MRFETTRRNFFGFGAVLGSALVTNWPLNLFAASGTSRSSLPIPPLLSKDANDFINLTVSAGKVRFGDRPATPTYGVNGPFLGPAIRVRRGDRVNMRVHNTLTEPITMHWHGLIVPGEVDGGPHQLIAPGQTWVAPLEINQPAATLWFHPHVYPTTAELVIKGIAGLLIVDDEESDTLPLPSEWGVDDIPLVLQDRRFNSDGSFFHGFNLAAVTVGYVGDTVLVNGAEYPAAKTAKGWVRFRILNGSNARSYHLQASDRRNLYVVGSDGGLLAQPVAMESLLVHAGERFEILVDARDGKAFDFMTLPVEQPIMRLPPFDNALPLVTIDPNGADGKGTLPEALVDLPVLPASLPGVSQRLTMNMFRDDAGMGLLMKAGLMKVANGSADAPTYDKLTDVIVNGPPLSEAEQLSSNGVNGSAFSLNQEPIEVKRNELLRWRINENSDKMLHPVHIHGCQFRITSLNGTPPPEYLSGWKDTVGIQKSSFAEILVSFPKAADRSSPYMAHCHILEHEDSGMMTQFMVK